MAYQVLARKWRPQQFDDVVGQAHVIETLRNAITSRRLANAYLFVGPRGIGKTSIARIFAKALNCEKGPTASPCDTCDLCREIMAGRSLDVIEIDGASNNGVDQVRELRETVKYVPARGQYKIYIIDEVHMLSVGAFNALLKTLEEPPPHVIFIFATTEPDKVLATIISRCQRFDLRRIPTALIVERLRDIVKDEQIEADENALLAVARGAEGGLRDAESALDQLISFRGRRIEEADVLSVFGLVSRVALETLAEQILCGDVRSVIASVVALDEAGKDLRRLLLELMEHFRHLLVCLHVGDHTEGLDLTDSQIGVLRAQVKRTDTERLLRISGILADTEDRMRRTLSKRTLLETALVRCAHASTVVTIDDILARIEALQASGTGGAARPPAPKRETQAPAAAPPLAAPPAAPAMVREAPSVPPATPAADLARLQAEWPAVVARVGRMAIAAKGVLKDAVPVAVHERRVTVAFDPEFADARTVVESGRGRLSLERAVSDVLGREVGVDIRVGTTGLPADVGAADAPTAADEETSGGDEGPGEAASGVTEPVAPVTPKRSVQEWIRDPAVRKTLDLFGGTIREVRS